MVKLAGFSALVFASAATAALAGDQTLEDFFGSYFHRSDTIALSTGDAKNVNAMSEMLDPWPPYVRNRRLPANGSRMTGAVQRYEDVRKIKEAAPTVSPEAINPTGFSNSQGK
jgi:hypothetical protein